MNDFEKEPERVGNSVEAATIERKQGKMGLRQLAANDEDEG